MTDGEASWLVWSPECRADLRAAQEAADMEPPNGPVTDVYTYLAELEERRALQLQSYRLALLEIVNVLGPDGLCGCVQPCEELRTEAGAALDIAQTALQRASQIPRRRPT